MRFVILCVLLVSKSQVLVWFPAALSELEMDLSPREDALKHIAARRDKLFLAERFIDASKRKCCLSCKAFCKRINPADLLPRYKKVFC